MINFLYHLDVNILLFIQDHMRNPLLTPVFKYITALGNGGKIWFIVILAMLCYKKSRKTGIVALITFAMSIIINNVMLKNIIARPRPFTVLTQLQVLIAKPTDFSFPSGHTAISFAVAGAIFYSGNKKLGIGAFILASAIGFSRLYLGVHYPSDVIGGAIIGLFVSLMVSKSLLYLKEKKNVNILDI